MRRRRRGRGPGRPRVPEPDQRGARRRAPQTTAGDWLLVHVAAGLRTLAIVRDKDLIFFRTRQLESDGDLADLVHQTAMYHEDRLSGGRFARVVLSRRRATRGAEVGDRLRRGLEERMNVKVESLDFRGTAAMRDRISAGARAARRAGPRRRRRPPGAGGLMLRTNLSTRPFYNERAVHAAGGAGGDRRAGASPPGR